MPGLFTTIDPAGETPAAGTGPKDASNTTNARRPREDALPEHLNYQDEGCDLFRSCLTCPLPRCRYDQRGGARTMRNVTRDQEIQRLHALESISVEQIAKRVGVSRRTVFRVLQPARSTPSPGS
jgi:hypothetical protein